MTRDQTIQACCRIVAHAYHALGDYTDACDCFCLDGLTGPPLEFKNDGRMIAWLARAVREKLERDRQGGPRPMAGVGILGALVPDDRPTVLVTDEHGDQLRIDQRRDNASREPYLLVSLNAGDTDRGVALDQATVRELLPYLVTFLEAR